MASPYRLQQIVNEWEDREQELGAAFQEMIDEGGWKEYDFSGQQDPIKWEDLDEACHKCIFRQTEHYKKHLDRNGQTLENKFVAPCRGIPKEYLKPELLEHLRIAPDSPMAEDLLLLKSPSEWARKHCKLDTGQPLEPFYYQRLMLDCTSKRSVFRCGRRTGKSVAVSAYILWACMVQPFFTRDPVTRALVLDPETGGPYQEPTRVLIVTPRQTHADNIMATIKGFIDRNPLLSQAMSAYRSSPYYIVQFNNGSTITCVTAGTGTAAAGVSIRSFSASLLVLDEANYLGEADRKAIMAILATNQNTILRALSTPTGMQDFFWEWCMDKPTFKSFHFPTSCRPDWDNVRDGVFGDVETEDEFLHEYMAVFSPPDSGVFRPDLIRLAMRSHIYAEQIPEDGWIYGIGVDWNSSAGTEIFVVGLDTATGEYKSIDSVNVPKSTWTQLNALTRLIEMIKFWRPGVVCVDEGYGSTQIELLQRFALDRGHEHPAIADLRDTLIPYNFSSSIEVANPTNGVVKRKPAKPFLIENAVRRFEDQNLAISEHDMVLLRQLKSYMILRRSAATGQPVFGPSSPSIGDHRLDAFLLALVGFKLKFGSLDQPARLVAHISHIPAGDHDYKRPVKAPPPVTGQRISSKEWVRYEENEKRKQSGRPVPSRALPPTRSRSNDSPMFSLRNRRK